MQNEYLKLLKDIKFFRELYNMNGALAWRKLRNFLKEVTTVSNTQMLANDEWDLNYGKEDCPDLDPVWSRIKLRVGLVMQKASDNKLVPSFNTVTRFGKSVKYGTIKGVVTIEFEGIYVECLSGWLELTKYLLR